MGRSASVWRPWAAPPVLVRHAQDGSAAPAPQPCATGESERTSGGAFKTDDKQVGAAAFYRFLKKEVVFVSFLLSVPTPLDGT